MRILTFFGVAWESLGLADLANRATTFKSRSGYAVFASAETLAAALSVPQTDAALRNAAALYVYASEDRRTCEKALAVLCQDSPWSVRPAPTSTVSVHISGSVPALTGPMSGLAVTARLTADDSVLVPAEGRDVRAERPIVSASGDPMFVRFHLHGVQAYFCASAAIVDIDEPVRRNYYDVNDHFLSAVPLVMFLVSTFRDAMWRPFELGACVIIDDPLLKRRYGFCDFPRLRDLMKRHGFTTNVAFIPWNWRRTSAAASDFFRRESARFSVSIHGCDHIASEFGATSVDVLDRRARLAQARMHKHRGRTGIQHDPVMVFPQGVFSSQCPAVLKRNGFVAAVNTEILPVDRENGATLIRDVWDVAILRYGGFPIYTRRYARHGLENFAFDLLLGKPCFIVAHHGSFRDNGAELVELVDTLSALERTLQWRSPLEVIRRTYRRRNVAGTEEIEMYANELVIPASTPASRVRVRKKETTCEAIDSVRSDGEAIRWQSESGYLTFNPEPSAHRESVLSVRYREYPAESTRDLSLRYELSVAARRFLSEFRDEYVQRTRSRWAAS